MIKCIEMIQFRCIATYFNVVVVLENGVSSFRCFPIQIPHTNLYAKSVEKRYLDISTTTRQNAVKQLYNTLLYIVMNILNCKWILACCRCSASILKKIVIEVT